MKITLFTSNNKRHNYFINLLSGIADKLYVVQECATIFPGVVPSSYPVTELMKKYFQKVNDAQNKFFSDSLINVNSNTKFLPLIMGDLNKLQIKDLSLFLKSDVYVVFGSSYIKNDLINFLIKNNAINIHMGVSPFYRGTDCNFWALYDNNPHLVGSTIHMLSKGLDNGSILYHAMSNIKNDPFEYTMSTVKSALHSVSERINYNTIFNIKPELQNKKIEIRYSKKIEFNEEIVKQYFNKDINLMSKNFDNSLLKDPYFLN